MRLSAGGTLIDRGKRLRFTFDGKPYEGHAGDTLAAALLGAGVRIAGRSFKYHRPRGVWGYGAEEPNAIMDVTLDGRFEPNLRATTTLLADGLFARSVNATPTADRDSGAWIDAFARFVPAGFYYKTFMWPDWHVFEPRIRAKAGLGRIDPAWRPSSFATQVNMRCDVLVVGAGPAGLAAAVKAAAAGREVMVVDERATPGGSLLFRSAPIDGIGPQEWLARQLGELGRRGVPIRSRATAYGIYDHNLVCVAQLNGHGEPPTLWRVRPAEIVLATGAIERPLVFPDNDRPGVMSAEAALYYLRCHGVRVGETIAIVSNNDSTDEVAAAFRAAGAAVTAFRTIRGVRGERQVEAVEDEAGKFHTADAVLVSGGFTPTVHLYCQARGRLAWSERRAAFVPESTVPGMSVAGAAAGDFAFNVESRWPDPKPRRRAWIDFQSDVTTKDVALAARENFRSVEHLKRYTALGMATDQGKTSNLNGLAAMAALTGRSIAETGTTTYRPPYVPVSFMAFTGLRHGELFNPLRRLPLESDHRAAGAVFGEYGGWLRPSAYGPDIQTEALQARTAAGIFDATPLGKIEVIGPDAAAFLDFNYYGTMSGLKAGRIRYGFMLQETGVVFDDGVVSRLDDNRFIVSCSSSHVAGVHGRFEEWRQDQFDPSRVFIHNATPCWATLAVTGPMARQIVEALGLGADVSAAALPHMAFTKGMFEGAPARIARVSFSGDLSFEISVPVPKARDLFAALRLAGKPFGAALLGLEAMMILRAEKGYIVVGKDTDGLTMPHDLGLVAPRDRRGDEFVGRRSLFTATAQAANRKQLVGLAVADGEPPLPTGAHGIVQDGGRSRSIGYVTSSYMSPVLGHPIALGLIEQGLSLAGQTIAIRHLGQQRRATVVAACAFDPDGARLHV
jgi:sarcosine oxidase, subunit alpha